MTLEFTPAGFDAFQNNITEVSTVRIGTASSTGTANQALQVGTASTPLGGYISGNLGIGTTNPTSNLTVQGNTGLNGNININNTLPVTVSYAASFVVSGQEIEPREVSFSNDGRTMYVLGNTGNDITWYTLSTPWSITSASYVSQFSIASQTTVPTGLTFKPDGTKFYIVGTTGTVGAGATSVSEYSCRTPWDLTTAGFTTAFSVISQDTSPQDIEFSNDGTKFYVLGQTGDAIYQYSCTTPWSVASNVSYASSFSVVSQETASEGFAFSNDGTKLLLTGSNGDDINYYTLSTPWDITTTSFVGIITAVGVAPFNELSPSGLYWKPDGTKLYLSGYQNDVILEFNMTSNAQLEVTGKIGLYGDVEIHQDLSVYGKVNGTLDVADNLTVEGDILVGIGTTTTSTTKVIVNSPTTKISNTLPVTVSYAASFVVSGQETDPREVSFSNDGRTMYVLGNTGDDITWYTLSTPWSITSASYVSQFSIASQLTVPYGLTFKPDGTKFYIIGTTGTVGAGATSVSEYSCRTPWDLTTAGFTTAFSVISQDTLPVDVEFSTDGTKFYVLGQTGDAIYQYNCGTPWSVASNVSYASSFSVAGQEITSEGFAFSNDGTKLLLTGTTGDDINYYTLSTPWDITTTSFVGIITTVGAGSLGELSPSGLYWKPDGTKLYLSGYTNDSILEFNMTSNALLEVTGKTGLYGDVEIFEDLSVYGEQSNYKNAYFYNRVGIGTTNPLNSLHIVSSTTGLRLQRDDQFFTINANYGAQNHTAFEFSGELSFFPGGGFEKIRLTDTGNLGIGTTNPVGQLQVSSGPVIIGAATSTGTASQALQIGSASNPLSLYVSGRIGIGITNHTQKLTISNAAKSLEDGSLFAISSSDTTNPFQLTIVRSSNLVSNPYYSIQSVEQGVNFRNLVLNGSDGNVAIGSTLDTGTASQRLQVTGGAYFSGSVGIGTTNPTSKLHVVGGVTVSGGEQNLTVTSSSFTTIPATITTGNSPSTLQIFAGGMASGSQRGGQIDFVGGSASSDAGSLIFRSGTALGGTSQSEVARITATGSIGIGTTNPGSVLDVRFSTSPVTNNGAGSNVLRVYTTSAIAADTGGGIGFGGLSAPNNYTSYGQIAGRKDNSTSSDYAGYLQFSTNNTGGTMSERARIFSTGELAIGSTTRTGTASQPLQVTGGAYFSGSVGVGTTLPFTESSTGTFTISGSQVSKLYFEDIAYEATGSGVGQLVYDNGNLSWSVGSRNGSTTTGSSELFRVLENGNIGIGTTNPTSGSATQALHIYSTNTSHTGVNLQNASTGGQSYILQSTGSSASTGAGKFSIFDNTNNAHRFIVDSSGSIGIGITNPGARLHVIGNILVSGIGTITTLDFGTNAEQTTTSTGITTTASTTIDSFSTSVYRSARVQVQITQGTNYQASDILIIHNGSTADIIEYGSIATNDYLGIMSGAVSGGNCLLRINMASPSAATVKTISQRITV